MTYLNIGYDIIQYASCVLWDKNEGSGIQRGMRSALPIGQTTLHHPKTCRCLGACSSYYAGEHMLCKIGDQVFPGIYDKPVSLLPTC